jgi:Mg-chelatase subunit ChlD
VVHDATMLASARETRLSETTFVQAATQAGADYGRRDGTPEPDRLRMVQDRPRASGDVVVVADGHARL